jgi:hypothetical protein
MTLSLQLLAWTMSCLAAQDPKDPQEVLVAFDADLVKAIREAPKDMGLRTKLAQAAKKVFDMDLAKSVDKTPRTRWGCHTDFMARLVTAEKHYADANDKAERALWITACKSTFAFELAKAQDPNTEALTTEEAFNELYDAIVRVKKDFPGESAADIRTSAYQAARTIFNDRLRNARRPGKEPQSAYAEEMIKIDKTFPLPETEKPKEPVTPTPAPSSGGGKSGGGGKSSGGGGKSTGGGGGAAPEQPKKDYTTEPNTLLKGAAKAAFDRALAAPKQ